MPSGSLNCLYRFSIQSGMCGVDISRAPGKEDVATAMNNQSREGICKMFSLSSYKRLMHFQVSILAWHDIALVNRFSHFSHEIL